MIARMLPIDGGPPFSLEKALTVVGRNDTCDVRIEHKSISKLHCVLVVAGTQVLVRDLGSTNGTRINGQRVRRAALTKHDILGIAGFKYRLKFGPGGDSSVIDEHPSHDGHDDANDTHAPEASPIKKDSEPVLKRNVLPDTYDDEK